MHVLMEHIILIMVEKIKLLLVCPVMEAKYVMGKVYLCQMACVPLVSTAYKVHEHQHRQMVLLVIFVQLETIVQEVLLHISVVYLVHLRKYPS